MTAIARAAYSALLGLVLPLALLRLWWRGRREPGYREHVGERLGRYRERIDLPVIWVHAVSVGETRAAQPLVEALLARYPDHRVLLTHGTPTGRETGTTLFADRVSRAYLAYDLPWAVRRFLGHYRPVAGALVETELWFNLLDAARAAGVPVCLVNARLSERSARGYRRFAPLAREALASLAGVYAQTEADAARLAALGAPAVEVLGNLKFDLEPAPDLVERGRAWRARLDALTGSRAVWLAASTREGEEPRVLDAFRTLLGWAQAAKRAPPLLALVPRHPQRVDAVASLAAGRGFAVVRRSALFGARTAPDPFDVLLGDSLGEMYAWYAAADVALVGGSLLPHGGQNLIEACAVGCPVLIGPHTDNFAQATALALAAGAAERVTAETLAGALAALLDDAGRRDRMGAAGRAFAAAHRGATVRTVERFARLVERAR